MRLEKLYHGDKIFAVGVTEIQNVTGSTKDQLVELASDQIGDLLAIQFLDSSLIVDTNHLLSASQNALNAWNGDYAISRSLALEIVVYTSTQKQIGKALDLFGVKDKMNSIALVVVGATTEQVENGINDLVSRIGTEIKNPFDTDDARLSRLMEYYGVTYTELETLTDSKMVNDLQEALSKCVASRVSLVAVEN